MEQARKLEKPLDLDELAIDSAPFQLVLGTSLYKVHSLFSLLGLNHAYVTHRGRLVGVVALKEVRFLTVLGENIPRQNTPRQNIPRQKYPIQNIPRQNIPRQNIPYKISRDKISRENIPRQNIPRKYPTKISQDKISPTKYPATKYPLKILLCIFFF
jgi:hypothetical protein